MRTQSTHILEQNLRLAQTSTVLDNRKASMVIRPVHKCTVVRWWW
jgi:hypothetical protein